MRPRVVICGTFHRDPAGLRRIFKELETTGCRVLSPISIDFEDVSPAIVTTANENDMTINELETFHLRAMRDADLIWLHNPKGHVGVSAAYELGFASALRKPVFCFELPNDEMLQTRTITVRSVFEALEAISF